MFAQTSVLAVPCPTYILSFASSPQENLSVNVNMEAQTALPNSFGRWTRNPAEVRPGSPAGWGGHAHFPPWVVSRDEPGLGLAEALQLGWESEPLRRSRSTVHGPRRLAQPLLAGLPAVVPPARSAARGTRWLETPGSRWLLRVRPRRPEARTSTRAGPCAALLSTSSPNFGSCSPSLWGGRGTRHPGPDVSQGSGRGSTGPTGPTALPSDA